MQLITNLNFNGQCEEAFTFYAQALQAKIDGFSRYKEMPADPAMPIPADMADKIMHVSLSKNGQLILMGADAVCTDFSPEFVVGTNVEICIMPDDKAESDRIFTALCAGGEVVMPMEDQFWGDYFGACKDKYGIGWMINCPWKTA